MTEPLSLENSRKGETQGPIYEARESSLLRFLREKVGLTQEEVTKQAGMTRGQIQHIEQKDPNDLKFGEIQKYAKGIGYAFLDLARLIHAGKEGNARIFKCAMNKPVHATKFGEGVELVSLIENSSKNFVGILNLEPSKNLAWNSLPFGDSLFGMVIKGRLNLESLGEIETYEEKTCFVLHGCTPFELHNAGLAQILSILLFSTPFSDL